MKALMVLVFLMGAFLIVGSSGNFREYSSSRAASVMVVPHEDEYVGFNCSDGEIASVVVSNGGENEFDVMTLENQLITNEYVSITLEPAYSYVPGGVYLDVESGTGTPVDIAPGDSHTFGGHVAASSATPGEYYVPVTVYATWEGGGAVIESCPIKITVLDDPMIKKVLLSGNTSDIPLKTYQEWTFQIEVSNPTNHDMNLTVRDTIPAEFNVSLSEVSASSGTYSFWASNQGNGNGNGNSQPATKMKWEVLVPAGGSEHINVTIFTRVNHGNQQEFTSCGTYSLNNGATIDGYPGRSNGIEVSVACSDDD
ncbi:hypothetical protein [Thermococcus stetteri]|uniref:hypothetical protein n=1 Tax=Thermococcus stetteri TaxID=49900 RepID=UPI001AE680B6|nr:hypothetical protein [Thermococcus stetteri]MBP1911731.1 hypothetical protein [Thermococcus stetteri]